MLQTWEEINVASLAPKIDEACSILLLARTLALEIKNFENILSELAKVSNNDKRSKIEGKK